MEQDWLYYSSWILPLLSAVILHEIAHGWIAEKFGDPTARIRGRITLNPISHIDPMGTIVLPFTLVAINAPFIFGGAKPVPVHFGNLRPLRIGMAAVALAGPMTNFILAIACALLLHLDAFLPEAEYSWLYLNLYNGIMINLVLGLFNLLPILPLDGGRVVTALLPPEIADYWQKLERFGLPFILAALFIPAYFFSYPILEKILLGPLQACINSVLMLTGHDPIN
jgi:Zn-dependent protease